MDDFQDRLSTMQSRNSSNIDEFNRKLQLQQEKFQKALVELTKKFNEQLEQDQASVPKTSRPSSRGTNFKNTPQLPDVTSCAAPVIFEAPRTMTPKKSISPPSKIEVVKRPTVIRSPDVPKRKTSSATASEVGMFEYLF